MDGQRRAVALLCVLCLGSSIHAQPAAPPPSAPTSLASLAVKYNVGEAVSSITQAGLASILSQYGAVTLFLPTDRAFAATGSRLTCVEDYLTEQPCFSITTLFNASNLRQILLQHAVVGTYPAASLTQGLTLQTIGESTITVSRTGNVVSVNDAPLTQTDVNGGSGFLIHVLGVNVISRDGVFNRTFLTYNSSTVAAAEKLADVGPFTNFAQAGNTTKRDLVMRDLQSYRDVYSQVRTAVSQQDGGLSNPMMLSMNPTFGRAYPTSSGDNSTGTPAPTISHSNGSIDMGSGSWQYRIPANVTRPADNASLAFYSVLELASLMRNRQVTAVELVEIFTARMQQYDYVLEAVVTYTTDLAMQQAKAADALLANGTYLGPLHGIPYGLKDLIAVPGYRTTWGADPYIDQIINEEAHVYTKLREAGAVLVAKLVTGGMAWGNIWWGGATKCPWNVNQGASGSSAGPAAGVSAALVPFAIGSETGGSIVLPSVVNGVTALRPSFGIVGRSQVMSLAQSLDHVGPFCRQALDCAVVLDAIRGNDPADVDNRPVGLPDPFAVDLSNLTVGFIPGQDGSYFDGYIGNTTFQQNRVLAALRSQNITTVPISLDYTIPGSSNLLNVIMYVEAAAHFDYWQRSGQDDENREQGSWPTFLRSARLIPAVEYVQAQRARSQLCMVMAAQMAKVDVILVTGPFDLTVGNLCGFPHMPFPTGYVPVPGAPADSPRRAPITAAIIGPVYSDALVLAVVAAYQEVTTYHLQQPPIDAVDPGAVSNATRSQWSRATLPAGSRALAALTQPTPGAPIPTVTQLQSATGSATVQTMQG